MPKTRLISPGSIPNHRLLKNLQLDDNYLTNDGGTEGISINDDGNVTVTGTSGSGDAYLYIRPSVSQQCYLKMGSAGYEDYAQIQVDHASTGDMVFWTANTEKLRIRGSGNVGIGTSIPASKLEIFNTNVQHSDGTASQSSTVITGSGTTFTEAMVGGRFIFDNGTDAGIIIAFATSEQIVVSTSQTVSSGNYKIYYPSVQIATESSSTTIKLGDITIGTEDINLGLHGDFTVNANEDIALSADGGNITMNDGSTTVFDFDVDNVTLKIMDDADTGDYCSIGVGANGATTIATLDDDGNNANLSIVADGNINLNATGSCTIDATGAVIFGGLYLSLMADTKASSGTDDSSFVITETLNLSSGAGGTDVHYGLKYAQTQTDLTGWDSVYLMHLSGGAGKILSVDNNANIALSNDRKVIFGDAGEYIAGDGTDLSITSSNHLTLTCGGNLVIAATGTTTFAKDVSLAGTYKIFFDSGDTFIGTNADDPEDLLIEADQDILMSPDNHLVVDAGGHVEFDNCAVGFDKLAGTFGTSGVIGDGNDSTDIDFRLGNKYQLGLTDNISGINEYINMIFPATSGNFLLVIYQDPTGSRTVAAAGWKAYASDASLCDNTLVINGTDGEVRWVGGTAPTLSTAGRAIDVISIYWDADNQTALAMASLGFATP